MAHLLFADANESALRTMMRAVELGHELTFVRGLNWQLYVVTEQVQALFDRIDVVEMELTSDTDALEAVIARIHAAKPVDAVIAQIEPTLEAIAVVCDRLGLRFTSAAGVCNARNKVRTRELLADAGLATVGHAHALDVGGALAAAARIGYPVVVKPVSGLDSMMVSTVADAAQMPAAAREVLDAHRVTPEQMREQFTRGILVEQYLVGRLVSAELAIVDGVSYRFMISGRSRGAGNDCVEMGAALPADLDPAQRDECFEYAEQVCRALGLDFGVFHLEIMLTDRGPVLVEANPRVMGGIMTTMYGRVTGVDFADHLIDVYLGRPPSRGLPEATATITARKIMPVSSGTLPGEFDLGWVSEPEWQILELENYHLRPGREVRAKQVLARYVVLADSWTEAMTRADGLVDRFEKCIGVPLVHSDPAL
ncbi:ATP-grasp domain-containing protein [Lentzea kentuckyensis]|uniref:ATP-grasp domain-containing protein n=1 Tax=Lentzea kentuckyensis TaxID=360086 RepID=UPI000A382859|nr:ATP-grasp domain-containing protein [Lentzea kentuckyensis]